MTFKQKLGVVVLLFTLLGLAIIAKAGNTRVLNANTVNMESASNAANFVALTVPSSVTPYTFKLPGTVGSSGQALYAIDGSGTLGWLSVFANPMTTTGDLIYSSSGSTPARLGAGTSVQLLHSGTPPTWSAVTLTTDVTGTLPVANGGTGLTSAGSATTVLHGGSPLTYSAVTLTTDVSGTLPLANGGTGQVTKAAAFDALSPMTTAGDLIYGGLSGTGTRLAVGSATTVLHGGASAPVYGAVSLTADVSGTLPVANGGTNSATSLSNNRVMQSSAGAIVEAAAITASRALASDTNGIPVASATTAAELGFVSGVTSAIQTQLNAKTTNPLTTAGDIIYASNTATPATPARLAVGSATTVLHGGASAPAYSAVSLTADVSGILPVANGGTALASGTSGGILAYTASGTLASSGALTANAVVIGGGAGVVPTVVTNNSTGTNKFLTQSSSGTPAWAIIASGDVPNIDASKITSGTIAISQGGTNGATATAGFNNLSPLTTKGDIVTRDSTNNIRLAVGADGTVLTAASGQTSGLQWTSPLTNPMTTLGDIIIGGSSGSATRLAGNTANSTSKVLTSTATAGVANSPTFSQISDTNFFTSAAAATASAYGVVTTFIPSTTASVKVVTSADYTVLTTDGYEYILVSTGNSDRTVTLPAASANGGRRLKIVKTDTGTGAVILARAGSDTINGATSQTTNGQYSFQHVASDGTSVWYNIEEPTSFGSIAPTFLMNASGNSAGAKTILIKRVGNWVTLMFPGAIQATANGTTDTNLTDTASTRIPSWARPAGSYNDYSVFTKDGGSNGSTPGLLDIDSAGVIIFYKNALISAWVAGTSGVQSRLSAAYDVTN
jgi:hypothetical protein